MRQRHFSATRSSSPWFWHSFYCGTLIREAASHDRHSEFSAFLLRCSCFDEQTRRPRDHRSRSRRFGQHRLAVRGGGVCAMSKALCDDENRSPLSPLFGIDNRFRIIFDAVTEGIFISNPTTGRFIEINQSGCSMFGYDKSELIGRDIETLSSGVHPYTQDMATEWIGKTRLGEPQIFEWQCKTKDDEVLFWAEISIRYTVFDLNSVGMRVRVPAVLAIVRNIAERKRTERALQRLNRTLRTVSAANTAVVRATTEEELLNELTGPSRWDKMASSSSHRK